MPKLKTGEVIGWKETAVRFKKGVNDITPLQKLIIEKRGTFIMLMGFILSLVVVIIKREDIGLLSYGLILIFLGSCITTIVKYISMRQQLQFLKSLDLESIDDINKKEDLTC